MATRYGSWVVTLSVVLMLALPGRGSAETLADVLVAAYRNSNLLEQNRALLRATDEDLVQAQARLLPVVRFITGAQAQFQNPQPMFGLPGTTRSVSVSATLSATVPLIDFGRGQLGIQAAREAVLGTRAALVGVEQAVLLRAVQSYLNVRSTRDTVALRRNNVELIRQELRAARERFELGDSTRTDVAIAEARLAASQSALSAAEGDFAVAREDFNFAVGRYPGALVAPPRLPRLPRSLDEAQATARQNHPAIRQAQHQVAGADLQAQIVRAQRMGTVAGSLTARGSATGATSRRDVTAGVDWSVDLYTGGQAPSAERRAIAQHEAQRAALHQTVAQVFQSVAANWAQLAVARARLEASDLQIAAAQSAYEAVRAEAELGSRTTLDVLNAEQELLDAQSGRIVAAATVQLAAYALLEATGQLTAEALNLGIPTYDVDAYSGAFQVLQRSETPSEQGQRLDRIMQRQSPLITDR
ncbi:MAG: TolC family outer membrane protein [Pararhodobacter sp.]